MSNTIINPEQEKYFLCSTHKRYYTTRDSILGKRWRRAHLVWTYYHGIKLEILQRFLNRGYCIHHINGIITDDRIENLELKRRKAHNILHNSGEKHPLYGKKHTSETKEKMSKALQRHDISIDQIESLIQQGRNAHQIAKELSVNIATIWCRLKKLGYTNKGSDKKPLWIKNE